MTILYPIKPRHRRRYNETQHDVTVCAIMEENGVYLRRYMKGSAPRTTMLHGNQQSSVPYSAC